MRASRLLQLLLILQMRGQASATELAAELEVSVRTIYRDVEALSAAGVPIYAEPGRTGGIRLLDGYRVAGLPVLDDREARALLLAAMPAVAEDLGLVSESAERKLLGSMEPRAEAAAVAVRDRLLVEPEEWWRTKEETPFLTAVARGVWEAREVRITYRSGGSGAVRDDTVQPLGLVLKGSTWYLVARPRRRSDRIYRVARIEAATLLDHRFERPADFELAAAWEARKEAFTASIPRYFTAVRVAPAGERLLSLLQEGTPPLPLGAGTRRDADGWALLTLRFERPASAARLLLQLGAAVEVLDPPELRTLMTEMTGDLHALYHH